jgi:hypothetical protein
VRVAPEVDAVVGLFQAPVPWVLIRWWNRGKSRGPAQCWGRNFSAVPEATRLQRSRTDSRVEIGLC